MMPSHADPADGRSLSCKPQAKAAAAVVTPATSDTVTAPPLSKRQKLDNAGSKQQDTQTRSGGAAASPGGSRNCKRKVPSVTTLQVAGSSLDVTRQLIVTEFPSNQLGLVNNRGRVGICSQPGLLDKRPGRNDNKPQRDWTIEVRSLKEQGYNVILSVLEDYELQHYTGRPFEEYKLLCQEFGVAMHHYPVKEGAVPSVEKGWQMALLLAKMLQNGMSVIIHSKNSWGRACTVMTALLLWANPTLQPDEAITHVRSVCGRRAIQTVKQYNFLHDFSEFRRLNDRGV